MKKKCEKVSDFGREVGQIMEINVNSTRLSEVLTRVERFISDSHKFYIVTPNPELILMAQENKNLKNALNSATMSIPDGVGLKVANPNLKIIKGRELFLDLIKLANQKGWKIFLLGGTDNEAELAAKILIGDYPELKVKYNGGPMLDKEARPLSSRDISIEREVKEQINEFKPQLLFVAYGNPKQEIWINENISKLNARGAMAVGGTLRYIAGLSILPPRWIANCGLEWLWRGLTEPKRLGRIFRAVVVFPLRCFTYFLSKPLQIHS